MRAKLAGALALLGLALGPSVSAAPEPIPIPVPEADPGAGDPEWLLRQLDETLGLAAPSGFGGDLEAWQAYAAIEGGRYVRARELTEGMLRADPDSIAGHALLGMVLHHGEGSLARAHYHLLRSRNLFESRHGRRVTLELGPSFWHWISLYQLASVAGEMERHEEELEWLDELEELYGWHQPAQRGWPLMRLRRLEEGRRVALAGIASGELEQALTSYTALCAIEAEAGQRQASYEACLKAVELGVEDDAYALYLTNAAEGALAVLNMHEAERLLLLATDHFTRPTLANPWMDLVHLYLSQGRTAEALQAMRAMFSWRLRQPPSVDVQTWGETDLASALFLIAAGRPIAAARITSRTIQRPDRAGLNSADFRQKRSAAALLDWVAHRAAYEVEREAASWQPWRQAIPSWFRAARHRLRAWSASRRAAALFADDRLLLFRLRPYLGGVVKIPTWIEPELVAVLGPGPVEAAARQARAIETLPQAEGYFDALAAEIAHARGDAETASARATLALQALPQHEALLRARVAAIGAQAAEERGQPELERALFELALQLEPGILRRVGAVLPCVFEPGAHPIAEDVARHLRASPRLRRAEGAFRVRIEASDGEAAACLLSSAGAVLACGNATLRADESPDALARRAAAAFHARVFAPRVDLTQADLRSLDGSTLAGGGRSAERLRIIVEGISE